MSESKLSKSQENKLSTLIDLDQVLERYSSTVEGIPAFAESVRNFRELLSAIRESSVERGTVLKGKTLAKSTTRVELENAAVEAAAVLFAFGTKKGDAVVTAVADVTPSTLDRLRDTEVLSRAIALQRSIAERIDLLADYGFSGDDMERFNQRITRFESSNEEKSSSASRKKYLTKSLGELFQTGFMMLDTEIDMFVNSLRTKDKTFYDSYYGIRSVKNLGIRHKKLPEGIQQQQNA
jgi:hypothetical protein